MVGLLFDQRRLLVLAVAIILVAGITSAWVMPRTEDPELTQRVGFVRTSLPGATTARVESLVAEKIIEELREVEEVKEIRSATRPSTSTVRVTLNDDIYDVDDVWARVRDRLEDVQADLPLEAEDPELTILQTKAYSRIIGVSWDSGAATDFRVMARVADELKDLLRDIPETEVVDVFGEPEEELLVEINNQQLLACGLTPSQVADQIRDSDPKLSAGQIHSSNHDMLIEVGGELDSIERIGNVSLRSELTGESLVLRDVASIAHSIKSPPESVALIDGNRGILLGALLRSDAKIDAWTRRVDAVLDDFRTGLPANLQVDDVFDQSQYVAERISGLVINLITTCLVVSVVVFIMLGWRSALIVSASLPLTGCMVLAGLRFLEIPLHQMSLTGLIISLGLLIDNAIVAADEVQHRLLNGVPRRRAVVETARQLWLPLLGSTITTALSFAPIAMIPGPSGEFVGTIAISVILSIGCSLLVSLSVVAVVTAIFFPRTNDKSSRWRFGFTSVLLSKAYQFGLSLLFRFPILAIALSIVPSIYGFYVAPKMKEQFFPPAERNQFHIEVELDSQASIAETSRTARRVSGLLDEFAQVERVDWVIGESVPSFYYNLVPRVSNSPRYAQAHVRLTSHEGSIEIINKIQQRLQSEITEAQCRVRQLEQGPPFNAPIELRLLGPDKDMLLELGERVRARLIQDSRITCTQADLTDSMPKLVFDIGTQEAQLAGLELREIASQLNNTLEGAQGGSVVEGTEELQVRVRLTSADRSTLADIGSVDLRDGRAGASTLSATPVSAISHYRLVPQQSLVSSLDGRQLNEVRAYTMAGVLPSAVLAPLKKEIESGEFAVPSGYQVQFGGESSKRDEAVDALFARIGMLVVLMIAALVVSLQSYRAAFIIAAVAGLSFGLGFLSVWGCGFPRGFTCIIGTMGLIGIAINDSIVVLAALRRDPGASCGDRASVVAVVTRETRHVLATTLTTVFGLLPVLIDGGSFWAPLVVAIAGGVLGATLLALIAVPAAHLLLTKRSATPRPTQVVTQSTIEASGA